MSSTLSSPRLHSAFQPLGPPLLCRIHRNYAVGRGPRASQAYRRPDVGGGSPVLREPAHLPRRNQPRRHGPGVPEKTLGHRRRGWWSRGLSLERRVRVLNGSTIPAVRFLRRRETHQCRLVSYNRTRLPYLWGVRMLGYVDGTGWAFLEQGA